MRICPDCDGSGEGMYPGTICLICKGSGESLNDSADLDNQEYEKD